MSGWIWNETIKIDRFLSCIPWENCMQITSNIETTTNESDQLTQLFCCALFEFLIQKRQSSGDFSFWFKANHGNQSWHKVIVVSLLHVWNVYKTIAHRFKALFAVIICVKANRLASFWTAHERDVNEASVSSVRPAARYNTLLFDFFFRLNRNIYSHDFLLIVKHSTRRQMHLPTGSRNHSSAQVWKCS